MPTLILRIKMVASLNIPIGFRKSQFPLNTLFYYFICFQTCMRVLMYIFDYIANLLYKNIWCGMKILQNMLSDQQFFKYTAINEPQSKKLLV